MPPLTFNPSLPRQSTFYVVLETNFPHPHSSYGQGPICLIGHAVSPLLGSGPYISSSRPSIFPSQTILTPFLLFLLPFFRIAYDDALDCLSEIHSMDPGRMEDMDFYAQLMYAHGMDTELAHLADHAYMVEPYRYETCAILGYYHYYRNEQEDAVAWFLRAVQMDRENSEVWCMLGIAYLELDSPTSSLNALKISTQLNPRNARAWSTMAQVYHTLRLPSFSRDYYQKCLSIT